MEPYEHFTREIAAGMRGKPVGAFFDFDGTVIATHSIRDVFLERLRNGRLMRRFKVQVEDAEPGEVLDVHVNGLFVGEVVINDLDEGAFELRTHTFIKDPGDGEPMPRWFPSLVPGDVVDVGPLSVILEAF